MCINVRPKHSDSAISHDIQDVFFILKDVNNGSRTFMRDSAFWSIVMDVLLSMLHEICVLYVFVVYEYRLIFQDAKDKHQNFEILQ